MKTRRAGTLRVAQRGGKALPVGGHRDAAIKRVPIEFLERGELLCPGRIGARARDDFLRNGTAAGQCAQHQYTHRRAPRPGPHD